MMKVVFSIKPEFCEKIFTLDKTYEFRKVVLQRKANKMFIYATAPISKILGEATIDYVVEGDLDEVWKITSKSSGITEDFFYSYFKNSKKAVAYHLKDIVKYPQPKLIKEIGLHYAPQSFAYVL